MQGNIESIQIGLPKEMPHYAGVMETAVRKDEVNEAFLAMEGFEGDEVANKKYHGGLDRAILLYAYDHYDKWEKEFHTKLRKAAFGENVTVGGLTEDNVHIGDIYQIGAAFIQITQSRIPCDTLSKNNNIKKILPRLVETGYTGYLARVIQEGLIYKSDKVTLIERQPHSVSVLFTHNTYFHDKTNKEAIKRILACEALAEDWKNKLNKLIL
ncbi:MOSC domain-containing protein [Bacillus sp. HMF5848]|uniref:MOSC domain-containing protein n=1 Tax=Bacillus sp. HMF5848 TaxID=2495421 RepID=UPI000F7B68E4|nr:MOSC domain-containing protein [Bacillus sp. HMF5848]RSK27344.1 MOSC domain-containing protein [Bacillus sp. HMF5848]